MMRKRGGTHRRECPRPPRVRSTRASRPHPLTTHLRSRGKVQGRSLCAARRWGYRLRPAVGHDFLATSRTVTTGVVVEGEDGGLVAAVTRGGGHCSGHGLPPVLRPVPAVGSALRVGALDGLILPARHPLVLADVALERPGLRLRRIVGIIRIGCLSESGLTATTFLGHVPHVVGVSPYKEVCRIHTTTVVAAVADLELVGNRAVVEFP